MRDDSLTARAGRFRATLADIATLHDATFDPPADAAAVSHRPPGSRLPLPVGPLSARHDARQRLVEMVLIIAARRALTTRLTASTPVPDLAEWVALHVQWIVGQEELSGRVYDLEEIAKDIRRAALPLGIRQATVGPCPHCAGKLTAWIDDEHALPGRITCDEGGHAWDRDQWRHLGRILDATPDLLDATQLAGWLSDRFLTSVEPATVWQWARRGHIVQDDVDLQQQDPEQGLPRPRYDKHTVAEWFIQHRARRAG